VDREEAAMRYAVYAQYAKARHFTDAIVAGFPGRVRNIEPGRLARDCVHVLGGLQFGCLELLQEIWRAREPYIFFDNAYFGGGTYTDRLRLTRNAYQRHWVGTDDPQRLAKWGVQLAPWREDGAFVMVVPPSPAVLKLFGLPEDWAAKVVAQIRASTGREVRVSTKDEREKSPRAARLEGCQAVVTWSSNVAVEALCLGVPVFTGPWSAAAPVSMRLDELRRLDAPARPARERWAASLACGQWTVDEIAARARGCAWTTTTPRRTP
jgi:hypothetical protein